MVTLFHRGKPEGWILATALTSNNPRLALLTDDFHISAVSQAVTKCFPRNSAWTEVAVPWAQPIPDSDPISQSLTAYLFSSSLGAPGSSQRWQDNTVLESSEACVQTGSLQGPVEQ